MDMADTYTVRTEDGEIEVEDLDSLVSLARQGKIGRATAVRLEGGDWGPVEQIPEVAKVLRRDPWSAWENEGQDAESLLKDFERPAAPEVPQTSPAAKAPVLEDLPASAVAPIEEEAPPPTAVPPQMAPPAAAGVRRPPGEVIAFPRSTPPSVQGSHALDIDAHLGTLSPADRPAVARKPPGMWHQINWLRMMLIAAISVGGTMTWVWYVHTTSTAHFTHKPKKITIPDAPVVRAKPMPKPPVSPYASLEEGLREQLMEGILDISGEEQFEDALHIELRRVRLDVAWVRVKIKSWVGRKKDVPQDVRFQIRLRGRADELDRDLGALGLVIGKYVQHFGIEAEKIDVLMEDEAAGVRQVSMDPNSARRFFTHRMSLEDFLDSAFQTEG